jgi:radical SAM superfamily enzyme YgiQ (UPF0313 family)
MFGRPYTTAQIERSMDDALDAGCQRLDLFFMTGLRGQTYESVMGTVDYSGQLLARYAARGETRVIPFISPLAPFVDPGSRAFEEPEKYGYRLFCRTLEEHRQALLAPSWKYVLNYETAWMNRDQIVASTYEAGRRMNLLKAKYGIIDAAVADATDKRIAKAVALSKEIDLVMTLDDPEMRHARLHALKPEVDCANLSTVCDKRELEVPLQHTGVNLVQAAHVVVQEWAKGLARAARA